MQTEWVLDNLEQDRYSGRVFSDNKLLFRIPSWDYNILYAREAFKTITEDNVTHSLDNARHAFAESRDEDMLQDYIITMNQPNIKLSSKVVFAHAGEDEDLGMFIVPVKAVRPGNNPEGLTNLINYACWEVARVDTGANKRGCVENKSRKSKAAMALEALNGN